MPNTFHASSSSSETNSSASRPHLAFAQFIETVLQSALKLDAYQGNQLYALAPAVLKLHFNPIPFAVYVLITEDAISVQSHLQGDPDTDISANLSDWSGLNSLFEDLDPSTLNTNNFKNFTLSGQVELGEKFLHALQGLELDWEEKLSHYTGDLVAHQFGYRFRQWQGYKKSTGRQFLQMFEEYLKHEIRVGPSQTEFNHWKTQVDDTSNRAEELLQRAQQILK